MRLNMACLTDPDLPPEYHLPKYDVGEMVRRTQKTPNWINFGVNDMFRGLLMPMAQEQLNEGFTDHGIICCALDDQEATLRCMCTYDNLSIAISMVPDGAIHKELVASVAESLRLTCDRWRVQQILCSESLQMASFTIPESSYRITDVYGTFFPDIRSDLQKGPKDSKSPWGIIASMLLKRFHTCAKPLAMVAMGNFPQSENQLRGIILTFAENWFHRSLISTVEYEYFRRQLSFPWCSIDKIIPRSGQDTRERLEQDGFENLEAIVGQGGAYVVPYTNSEYFQTIVIENDFPNGRPVSESIRGVQYAMRDKVSEIECVEICALVHPLRNTLAIFGELLGYTTIAGSIADQDVHMLVEQMGLMECSHAVGKNNDAHIQEFLNKLLTQRFSNPILPDITFQIIDNASYAISAEFGEIIKLQHARCPQNTKNLLYIPLAIAGWLRYILGFNDNGSHIVLPAAVATSELKSRLAHVGLGQDSLRPGVMGAILSDSKYWGVDFYSCNIAEKIEANFMEMIQYPGAVRRTLQRTLLLGIEYFAEQ